MTLNREKLLKALEYIALDSQPSQDELPPLPAGRKALFPCEDCDGTGCTGEMIPATFIEPAEPVLCSTCNGSGRGYEAIAYEAGDMREYAALSRAQAAQQAQAVSDEQIDAAAHRLQEIIAQNGGSPSECAHDHIRDLCALLSQSAAPVSEQTAEDCGCCGGTGRMVRDPDIGTDQECFACEGTGKLKDEQPAQAANAVPEMEYSDRDRIEYCLGVMCSITKLGREKLGDIYPEAVTARGALKRVLQPAAQTAGVQDYEHRRAIMEGERSAACEEYFKALTSIDTESTRSSFEAGFERGFAAAPQPVAGQAAEMLDFVGAMRIADGVFAQYKEDHRKWWNRMDGTPILNDVAVRMAQAFLSAAHPQAAQAKGGEDE